MEISTAQYSYPGTVAVEKRLPFDNNVASVVERSSLSSSEVVLHQTNASFRFLSSETHGHHYVQNSCVHLFVVELNFSARVVFCEAHAVPPQFDKN